MSKSYGKGGKLDLTSVPVSVENEILEELEETGVSVDEHSNEARTYWVDS